MREASELGRGRVQKGGREGSLGLGLSIPCLSDLNLGWQCQERKFRESIGKAEAQVLGFTSLFELRDKTPGKAPAHQHVARYSWLSGKSPGWIREELRQGQWEHSKAPQLQLAEGSMHLASLLGSEETRYTGAEAREPGPSMHHPADC